MGVDGREEELADACVECALDGFVAVRVEVVEVEVGVGVDQGWSVFHGFELAEVLGDGVGGDGDGGAAVGREVEHDVGHDGFDDGA